MWNGKRGMVEDLEAIPKSEVTLGNVTVQCIKAVALGFLVKPFRI